MNPYKIEESQKLHSEADYLSAEIILISKTIANLKELDNRGYYLLDSIEETIEALKKQSELLNERMSRIATLLFSL